MPNIELFRRVEEQLDLHPELHDQDSWEGSGECGTTRCVAGWAIYLATGANLYGPDLRPSTGFKAALYDRGIPLDIEAPFNLGQELLGLDEDQATELFHAPGNSAAITLVRYYAQGGNG